MGVVTEVEIIERDPLHLMARVVDRRGRPVVGADVDAVLARVYTASGTLVTPTGGGGGYAGTALDPADVVRDEPMTRADDVRWPYARATQGYNFSYTLDGSFFPSAGSYQVEVRFTFASGTVYTAVWIVTAINIFGD